MWVVKIHLISVWGNELDLILVCGSELTWFLCGGRKMLGFSALLSRSKNIGFCVGASKLT